MLRLMEDKLLPYKVLPLNISCEQTVLKNTDGSALCIESHTKVLVGLYGPADCKESKQDVNEAVIEVNFRPKIGIPALAEKYLEQFVKKIAKSVIMQNLHPRAAFYIIVQIMQDQGCLLSCAINGVSMALQDAGVAMAYLPVAVTAAVYQNPRSSYDDCELPTEIIINPSMEIEKTAKAIMTFVFDSTKKDLISTYTVGKVSSATYAQSLNLAKDAGAEILTFYRDSISKKHLTKTID